MRKLLIMLLTCFALSGLAFAAAPVDLNSATQAQLESIKGVGPAKAKAIIEYRTKHGSFKSVDELDNVKGFGKKSVDKLRSQLTVRGAPAAGNGKEKGQKKK